MKKLFQLIMIVCASAMFFNASALAKDALPKSESAVIKELPRAFEGKFTWNVYPSPQRVRISLNTVKPSKGDRVLALGTGKYFTPYGDTDISVKLEIDLTTSGIEMWEMNPNSDVFITEGSHVGSISKDLKTIEAVWTTKGTGEQGKLFLSATE